MNRETHEKGSKSTSLEMRNNPQITQKSADFNYGGSATTTGMAQL